MLLPVLICVSVIFGQQTLVLEWQRDGRRKLESFDEGRSSFLERRTSAKPSIFSGKSNAMFISTHKPHDGLDFAEDLTHAEQRLVNLAWTTNFTVGLTPKGFARVELEEQHQ